MGADKNSSRRMNSAYAPNPQTKIPTRACQGRVVTKDLPTLGTSPKPIQHGSTTQKARDLGNLESTRRTVRSVRADCPRGGCGLSARRERTVRNCYPNLQYCTEKNGLSVMDPRTVRLVTDRLTLVRTVRKLHAPNTHRQNESKERRSRTRKNTKNSWAVRHLADGPW
jgi:hypothetical protein